ncbi:Peptide chain release factor RF1 [Gemmata obscuriglobus]|uniref:Peptide chain release factor 1 n=1 Tax=Gemmata obscuriglobus TaxID=114 RepID=A0A2Z3GRU5_9BACT|nr:MULTISPECIES: peptide chain release factor 1 [Gemmata]AWM36493.1 peptide chain release factor 1 [Gemmata obscuriglobus]MDY3556269.1 peptide chain release factor 1 [Gemmata algarum]QEG30880.1 Peptide chain release factor RF1 [Gemmata obscuriglobus]VTS10213.1 peptide chain release factor 1 : Peptide chain release factor 1 OS=Planctomyces limnophilus (strain ATCC 43296 / DSM 3776 / IFAM 1008 / 290) GN=prfA PE=3 SV=1: PCRF: RF-1 [Gemmata obscuriglobus UQM 2246]
MFPTLEPQLARYAELEQQLYDPAIAGDPVKAGAIGKERGALAKIVEPYIEYKRLCRAIADAEVMAADPDLKDMADEELADLRPKRDALHARIEEKLLLDPSEDFSKLIIEIRAGTGGDEAALFAGNLYEMYTRYAREKGWKIEEIASSPGEAGGFKEVAFGVTGDDVYQLLRYESGGHRVQRVPATETQGRIHTSAATVAVLPEPEEAQVEINEANDIEWERMRAGGAGGQHVNKTESAVRIWYKKGTPDEMEVKCQDGRSQGKNYEQAMRILRSRLFERQQERIHRERASMRKEQIGSGDRNARIRTYNFPQNRCTDHRIEFTVYKLDAIMAGALDQMIQPMRDHVKKEKLAANGAK